MSGRLPYIKRRKYPHMLPIEAELWGKFIDANPDYFDSVDYDFRVGDGMEVDHIEPPNIKRMAIMITQKRIDVVGWNDGKPTIVEVKERVGLSTLGQISGYVSLFRRDFSSLGIPEELVVCSMIGRDEKYLFDERGIKVEIV